MTSHTQTALTFPKTVAMLLSVVATIVWLGAVTASFSDAAKRPPRHIQLAAVTVTYIAPAEVAQLPKSTDSVTTVAAAEGKL